MALSLNCQNIQINKPLTARIAGTYTVGGMVVCLSIVSVECFQVEISASKRTCVWLCVCVCVLYEV
jgi:hypothetical protein